MKKLLLIIALASVSTLYASAQKASHNEGYQKIQNEIGLSTDQVSKIKQINREYGRKFEAIGKDRSIPGYEKGQRKRALARQKQEEIRKILGSNQIEKWESKYHGNYDNRDILKDDIDEKIDRLEDRYEAQIDAIDDNPHLSKSEKKYQIKKLKDEFKAEKAKLKQIKNEI